MNDQQGETFSAQGGSTSPVFSPAQVRAEASRVRMEWKSRAWLETSSFDATHWLRHKSLILNLAIADFSEAHESAVDLSVSDYCRRFQGLGDSLEHSIVRQLEVKKYLDDHPELLDLENEFSWPEENDVFHSFRVIEELGRGALARVYLVEQTHLGGRSAVVKIALGRHVNEAALLGKLRHPNIVPLHWADYEEVTGASYLCMPFLGRSTLADCQHLAFRDGVPWRSRVIRQAANVWLKESDRHLLEWRTRGRRRTYCFGYVSEAIRIMRELADALQYAHSQHVIHGDIKPSNVLLAPDGSPLLFDFNLGRDSESVRGPLGGTLSYMAPEQLRYLETGGEIEFPDTKASADIYSFGALCYELVTGSPPFSIPDDTDDRRAAVEALQTQQERGCAPPSTLNPYVDKRLDDIITGCLRFDPADRIETLDEVEQRLSRQLYPLGRSRRFFLTHPRCANASIGAGLLCLALAGGAYSARPSRTAEAAAAQASGDYRGAIELYDSLLSQAPESIEHRLERARCFIQLQDYDLAQRDLFEIAYGRHDARGFAYLGYCVNLKGDHRLAKGLYEEAIKLGLRTASILNNLTICMVMPECPVPMEERLKISEEAIREAVQLIPSSPVIRMNVLHAALFRLHEDFEIDLDEVSESARWLQGNYPDSATAWKAIFRLYHELAEQGLADRTTACSCLERAVQLDPTLNLHQLEQGAMFAPYRELPKFKALLPSLVDRPRPKTADPLATMSRFLDPLISE